MNYKKTNYKKLKILFILETILTINYFPATLVSQALLSFS